METLTVVVPEGNGYSVDSIRSRVIPHIEQAFHIRKGFLTITETGNRRYSLSLDHYAQEQRPAIIQLLKTHYGFQAY